MKEDMVIQHPCSLKMTYYVVPSFITNRNCEDILEEVLLEGEVCGHKMISD